MPKTQPNILFILIDDMGWKDLSCYGSTFYETPNIDRLAAEGMSFTDAYAACPVCSPTRGSILTGKYPARLGITDWIDWEGSMHPAKGKLIDAPYIKALPSNEETLASALSSANYQTWHVGKWHLGGDGHYPNQVGFDVNIGGCEVGSPAPGSYFSPWTIPTLQDAPVPEGTYLTDYLTNESIHLLEKRDTERPFFLNLWYYSVHTPIEAKEEKINKYRRKAQEMGIDGIEPFEVGPSIPCEHKRPEKILRRTIQSDPVYAAMIESLDENIGLLLDYLDKHDLRENTLVIFTSDNGGLSTAEGSPTCNAPLAEGKGWMYEGGTREPLLVRWPGWIVAGSRTDEPITSTDFYPTILEAASLAFKQEQHCDGESFFPLLKGREWSRSRSLFWHYPHYGNQGGTPGASIRRGDWKLIEFFEDEHIELYNLREDIGENLDRSETELEIKEHMHQELYAWQRQIGALFPAPNHEFIPWEDWQPTSHISPQKTTSNEEL